MESTRAVRDVNKKGYAVMGVELRVECCQAWDV
jgi:hypothetical protein